MIFDPAEPAVEIGNRPFDDRQSIGEGLGDPLINTRVDLVT